MRERHLRFSQTQMLFSNQNVSIQTAVTFRHENEKKGIFLTIRLPVNIILSWECDWMNEYQLNTTASGRFISISTSASSEHCCDLISGAPMGVNGGGDVGEDGKVEERHLN